MWLINWLPSLCIAIPNPNPIAYPIILTLFLKKTDNKAPFNNPIDEYVKECTNNLLNIN